jgi:hypothetical protein
MFLSMKTIRFDRETFTTDYDGRCGWFQLFRVFNDPEVEVIEATNPEYINDCYTAFKYFVSTTHDVKIKSIDYKTSEAVTYDYTPDPKKLNIKQESKQKWITSSWMVKGKLDNTDKNERLQRLHYRALDPELKTLVDCFYQDHRYTDLGQSRWWKNPEELIYKMQTVLDSKAYIGSTCSWSQWAIACGVPTFIFFDSGIPSRLKKDFVEMDLLL